MDHNIQTFDGMNTFHGMGITAAVSPGIKTCTPIPRVTVSAEDLAAIGRINIHHFSATDASINDLVYQRLPKVDVEDATSNVDLLWKTSLLLRSPRPCWSGVMQHVQHGLHPEPSTIKFLPMIDMDPSDLTCIYSTLKFVCAQATRLGVTPILTFDQPLWWKAILIVSREPQSSDLREIVLRLCGLHMEMSFLGCIGHLMAGSGPKELLEVIYASNAVDNMLTSKAMSRAVRGHMLVDAALNATLIAMAYDSPLPGTDALDIPHDGTQGATNDPPVNTAVNNGDLKEAAGLFDNLMSLDKTIEEICSADVLCRIRHMIERQKEALKQSRTACLWLHYMDMMDILRRFI